MTPGPTMLGSSRDGIPTACSTWSSSEAMFSSRSSSEISTSVRSGRVVMSFTWEVVPGACMRKYSCAVEPLVTPSVEIVSSSRVCSSPFDVVAVSEKFCETCAVSAAASRSIDASRWS